MTISLDRAVRFFCAESMTASARSAATGTGWYARSGHAAGAEAVRDLVEALVERPGQMHLRALRLLGKAAQRAREFGQAVFEIGGAAHGVDGFAAA